jgi:uncharacterized membrane protein
MNQLNSFKKQINSPEFKSSTKKRKIKRIFLTIFAIGLILIGWISPLLIIIKFLPESISIMCGGTVLIGIGTIIILFIATDKLP